MPSEYDALLEAQPTQQKSEYDQLLAQQPTAPSGAGEILKTAGKALLSTLGGFIPKSPLQAAEMATPLVGGVETLISTPKKLADVAFGGKSVAEAFPESQTLVEAEKTPAFSKERFEAGFGILGQIGMAAGLAKGLKLRDVALGKPESEIPLTSAAEEVTKNATQEGKIQESIQPERARDDARGASTETSVSGGIRPTAEVAGQEKIAQSAFKLPNGEIIGTGPFHQGEFPKGSEAGFLSTSGRFLGREEAGKLATGLKQPLFAEDFVTNHDIVPSLLDHPIAADAIAAGAKKGVPPFTESPSTEAAAVSGTEMPPAAAPQIPEGAKVNVKLRTKTGEIREAIGMDAKEAEGIFTKEKSSYQALLDCLGA